MTIKKQQLKEEIKSIVREALEDRIYRQMLKEVSPPGAKAERQIQHVKDSLRDSHPNWSDEKITSVAIATAWKSHNKKDEQVGANVVAESPVERLKKNLKETIEKIVERKLREAKVDMKMGPSYKVVPKTLAKTSEPDQPARTVQYEPDVNEATYKQVAPNETDTAKEDKARTIQTNPKVTENHKVQHRSYKTVDDMDNKPENVRDPEVPMS